MKREDHINVAVLAVGDHTAARLAKPAKSEYRRNLQLLQVEDKAIFITFNTYKRWQLPEAESFEHILRSAENVRSKVEYICQNPLRKGLVKAINDYPWLWREWVEGA